MLSWSVFDILTLYNKWGLSTRKKMGPVRWLYIFVLAQLLDHNSNLPPQQKIYGNLCAVTGKRKKTEILTTTWKAPSFFSCIVILTLIMQMKVSESALVVPSTSIAAHVVDEEVEIELEDKIEVVETAATGIEEGPTDEIAGVPFPLPPPPPIHQNNYQQVCPSTSALFYRNKIISTCSFYFLNPIFSITFLRSRLQTRPPFLPMSHFSVFLTFYLASDASSLIWLAVWRL